MHSPELDRFAERTQGSALAGVATVFPSLGVEKGDADVGAVGRGDAANGILARCRAKLFDRLDATCELACWNLDQAIDGTHVHDRSRLSRPFAPGSERYFQEVRMRFRARDAVGAHFQDVRALRGREGKPGPRQTARAGDEHPLVARLVVPGVVGPDGS